MTYPIAVLLGLFIGLATGYLAERVRVAPIMQSAGAAVAGMLLASLCAAVIWLLRPPPYVGVIAVSFGAADMILTTLGVALGAAAVHAVLGWTGHAALARHRGILLGLTGALYGAIAAVSGSGAVAPMR